MKLSISQLLLFVFLILNIFEQGNCFSFWKNEKKIYRNLYNATSRFISSLLTPLCADIFFNKNNIQSQYISSKGFSGRVVPMGTFLTRDLGIDYLHGALCPVGFNSPFRGFFQAVDLIRVTYDPKYFITQSEYIFTLTNNFRVTLFTTMAFDKYYKICGHDSQIRNTGLTFDIESIEIQQLIINQICTVTQTYCNGTLKQYDSIDACKTYLTTQIPFGSYDRGDQSTVGCRLLHSNLIPINPSRYCIRVGPSGGDTCVNRTIDFYYNQPNFLVCAHKYN